MKIKAHCPFLGHTGYNAHTRGFFTALNDLVDLRVDNSQRRYLMVEALLDAGAYQELIGS